MFRTVASTLCALAVGLKLLWWQTDGLRAFTQESARRLQIEEQPLALNPVRLELHNGDFRDWSDWGDSYVIVDFIFTRCLTLCTTLGHEFRRIQREADDLIRSGRLALLSVSFDPARDGPEQLQSYVRRYSPDDDSWLAARAAEAAGTQQLLDEFGVVVIADEWGGYMHNTALHLIAPDGRLINIVDYQDYSTLLTKIRSCSRHNPSRCSDEFS